jgi:hypothetical protein
MTRAQWLGDAIGALILVIGFPFGAPYAVALIRAALSYL